MLDRIVPYGKWMLLSLLTAIVPAECGHLFPCGEGNQQRSSMDTTGKTVPEATARPSQRNSPPLEAGQRTCEIAEGPQACPSGQACDMYRNRCVPVCSGGDCCAGVECPEGTVCVPALGRCGIPAGEGCYDLGTGWWSGRDVPPEQRSAAAKAAPAVFEILNEGASPLYLVATVTHEIRFDLYAGPVSHSHKLPLSVNHFCPTLCPETGPPVEIDCDQPVPMMRRLPAGQQLTIRWPGLEQVGVWRYCEPTSVKYCFADRATVPGQYTLEICAYTRYAGGRPHPNDPNRLLDARPAGEKQCRQVSFEHPTAGPITIRMGE